MKFSKLHVYKLARHSFTVSQRKPSILSCVCCPSGSRPDTFQALSGECAQATVWDWTALERQHHGRGPRVLGTRRCRLTVA